MDSKPSAPRRVLVIGPTPPPVGGDSVSTQRLLASRYWRELALVPVHVETSHRGRIRAVGDPVRPSDIVRGAGVLARAVRMIPRSDAVLGVMNTRFLCTAGLVVIAWARAAGKPVAVRIVGSYLPDYLARMPVPARAVVTGTLARADLLFPQTEETAEALVEGAGLPRARIVRLPNYVPDIAGDERLPDRPFAGRCVFVGQVKREKGVFDAIEAVSGLSGCSLDIFGPLLERDRRGFLGAVGAAPNVEYRGVLDPPEVRAAIARYDALLLPSYHPSEGHPGVVLEAFAAGVPVIAGDWRSVPRLVADGERGIIVPVRSPGKIREAIGRLREDGELRQRIRMSAREFVGAFTERAAVRDILLARIRLLVDGPRRGQPS